MSKRHKSVTVKTCVEEILSDVPMAVDELKEEMTSWRDEVRNALSAHKEPQTTSAQPTPHAQAIMEAFADESAKEADDDAASEVADRVDEIESAVDEVETALDELDGVEFPGMYG